MLFINSAIDLSELPAAEAMTLKPVEKKYLSLLRIEWTITAIVLLSIAAAVVYFVKPVSPWHILIPSFAVLLLLYYFIHQERSFNYLAYAVRDKDIIHQKGWIIRSVKICPFNRVQNCTLNTGPLERKYGLASLSLYTAGSSGADMRINGLSLEEAETLRQFILNKINSEDASTD